MCKLHCVADRMPALLRLRRRRAEPFLRLRVRQRPAMGRWLALALVTVALLNRDAFAAAGEPLGPSTRRTGLTFSEIMYHPSPRPDGKNLEFIEIYNSEAIPADVSGFRLSGDADYTFPTNSVIPAFAFLVVAPVPADVQSAYGIASVPGGFGNSTNALPNDSGTIRLRNKADAVLLEVNYADEPPWPASADGAGHSLVLARPSFGERDSHAWAASASVGGSPGRMEPAVNDPLSNVVINEFLAHTD